MRMAGARVGAGRCRDGRAAPRRAGGACGHPSSSHAAHGHGPRPLCRGAEGLHARAARGTGVVGAAGRQAKTNRAAAVTREPVTEVEKLKEGQSSIVREFFSNQADPQALTRQLEVTERFWSQMKRQPAGPAKKVKRVVTYSGGRSGGKQDDVDYDVMVCGGNLGIGLALALQMRGQRVLVVERRLLVGREQEWNASRKEFASLLEMGLITRDELESCIVSEFNPNRVSFAGADDVWVEDILNIGVAPDRLIALLKKKFLAAGGEVRELCEFSKAEVGDDCAVVTLRNKPTPSAAAKSLSPLEELAGEDEEDASVGLMDANKPNALPKDGGVGGDLGEEAGSRRRGTEQVSCKLVVDAMGHFSPIAKQYRRGLKAEGIVLVVGGCVGEGLPSEIKHSDVLSSFTGAKDDIQYFWEVFPAKDGTTVYMFAYIDAEEARPSFEKILERYLELLPGYFEETQGAFSRKQGGEGYDGARLDPVRDLKFNRLLLAGFPSFKDSPLQSPYDRVVQVGDSSSVQSPLSFGGFGAMLRHLGRITEGLDEALEGDRLAAEDLALVQPYMPALSCAWLFQRSMGFKPGQMGYTSDGELPEDRSWAEDHINRVLKCNFGAMDILPKSVLLSFLQDTIQFAPLSSSMLLMGVMDPVAIYRVVSLVGFGTLSEWFVHYIMLGIYTALDFLFYRFKPGVKDFRLRRLMDAWHYGSGADYHP